MNLKVAIFMNVKKKNIDFFVDKVLSELFKNSIEVLMCESYSVRFTDYKKILWCKDEESAVRESDVIVAMGGDGTIMRYAKIAAKFYVPIIGINIGRLGFISSLEKGEIEGLGKILNDGYFIDERILFDVSIDDCEGKCLALNDVVISRETYSQVVDYSVFRTGLKICGFRSDGVILSTATGSTAYSLSAGGPIVDPNVECCLVTPICAHNLNVRPMVLDSREEIRIEYSVREGSEICVMCDGDTVLRSNKSGGIRVKNSGLKVKFVRMDKDRFYKNVRLKLMG